MYYLIYISTAVKLMNEYDLSEILTEARRNNTAKNLTGLLLYSGGTFIQVIEGEEKVVKALYNSIDIDPRHKNLIQIASGPLDERNFKDWAMGFKSVNAGVLKEFEGYINPSNHDFLKSDSMHTALVILKTFAESNNILK